MPKKNIIQGRDLMLFIPDSTGSNKWKSIAYATSHQLNLSSETVDISTKDHGVYGSTSIKKIQGEITSSHLMSEDYDALFTMMTSMQEINVVFGLKKNETMLPAEDNSLLHWTTQPNNYKARAIITTLNLSAQDGEVATFDITLKLLGEIKKVTI